MNKPIAITVTLLALCLGGCTSEDEPEIVTLPINQKLVSASRFYGGVSILTRTATVQDTACVYRLYSDGPYWDTYYLIQETVR